MKKVILLLTVLALIAVGWFFYFNKGEASAVVGVHEVAYGNLENTLEFSGEVVCTNMYSVMSETGGTISKFYVAEGNRVNAGDKLFDLDSTALEAQLEEARLRYEVLSEAAAQTVMTQKQAVTSSVQQQKAAVALALSQTTGYDYESFNEVFGSGAGEQAAAAAATIGDRLGELEGFDENAFSSLDTDSQLRLAELAVRQLEAALDKQCCRSGISGTVLTVNIRKGEVLAPGMPAMVIADTESVAVTGYVYEKDVAGLLPDTEVTIITEDGNHLGRLISIGKAAANIGEIAAFDTMTKVQIMPGDGFDKMPGAVVDLKIVLSAKSGVLTIPMDCMTRDGCVFVINEDNVLEKRPVTTGFEDMFNVEIIEGLAEGDRIVAMPQGMEEGDRVSFDRG